MALNNYNSRTPRLGFGIELSRMKGVRASVVPYTIINGRLHFLFAVDSKSRDYTDMGGGMKGNEHLLSAAVREFKEESNEVFTPEMYDINLFNVLPAAIHERSASIFYPVENRWIVDAPEIFEEQRLTPGTRKVGKCYEEVSGLKWFDQQLLIKMCEPDTVSGLWKRLKPLYRTILTPSFLNLLRTVYTCT